MAFRHSHPTIALVLGEQIATVLDQHATELSSKPEEDILKHYDECPYRMWCILNTTPECRDEQDAIEWCLKQILSSSAIDEVKLRNTFSDKAKNPDQFDELLAEIATAATCACKTKLLELEWKTGKLGRGDEEYDADVRAEIHGEAVNLEVTLRTDDWLDTTSFNLEDVLDEDGNQIGDAPAAQSRRTLTERQWDDLQDTERVIVPRRVSDVIKERKRTPPKMLVISDPDDIPQDEQPEAYCADGDEIRVEARSVKGCIESKVKKFDADGFHVVVLATLRRSSPSDNSVFDTVFGQMPEIKHHGLFENGLNNEIIGVLYLPVYEQLHLLRGSGETESVAAFFPNHNSTVQAPEMLQNELAKVFQAKIRRGWIDQ